MHIVMHLWWSSSNPLVRLKGLYLCKENTQGTSDCLIIKAHSGQSAANHHLLSTIGASKRVPLLYFFLNVGAPWSTFESMHPKTPPLLLSLGCGGAALSQGERRTWGFWWRGENYLAAGGAREQQNLKVCLPTHSEYLMSNVLLKVSVIM